MKDMINDPELRQLAAKLITMCEDPGGIGDHVIYQNVAVAAELCTVYERGAIERTRDVVAFLHEHVEHLPDGAIEIAEAIQKKWPEK